MDRLRQTTCIVLTLIYIIRTVSTNGEANPCPSNICTCKTLEIASRLETQVTCNTGDNKGYVPVFKSFHQSISCLSLSKIELTTLGNQSFRQLTSIRELYLNDNYLIRIGARAFAEIDYTIELLDLQHNRLRELQFLITHDFSRLRELLLRDNQLVTISPGSLSLLPALENLNLDDNNLNGPLTFLRQPSLKALAYLNLDANHFTEINPEDFLHLTNIRSLLVNSNQLGNINFLSHPIFKQLQGFSAANNKLGNVNPSLFSDKNLIKWIDLSNNSLTNASFLSSCSLRSLEEIYLSFNQLASIPIHSFQATTTLSIFEVDNNLLQTLPRCALLKFHEQMQKFDISNNPMQCNCSLSWLQYQHQIATNRASQCINLEFTSTDNYETSWCAELPKCVVVDECTITSIPENPVYGIATSMLLQEYATDTTENSSVAQHSCSASLFSLVLILLTAIL